MASASAPDVENIRAPATISAPMPRFFKDVILSSAAQSTKFQRLRLRLRLGKIDTDSNSDQHHSLFPHVKEQCFKTVIPPLQCHLMQNIVGKLDNKLK